MGVDEENGGHWHILLLPQYFQKFNNPGSLELGTVFEGVILVVIYMEISFWDTQYRG